MSLGGFESPVTDGLKKGRLQHLESCTLVQMGKISSLPMGRRKVVSNILSLALEFGLVRLSFSQWVAEKSIPPSGVNR